MLVDVLGTMSHTDVAEDQEMDVEGDYNDEGEYDEGDDELFDDEDAEEAAEAVARQLGDALWADISKAYAQQGSIQLAEALESLTNPPSPHPPSPRHLSPSLSEEGDDEETLANATQLVLDLSTSQPFLHQVLSNTFVPQAQGDTLLEVLTRLAETKTVAPELAESLSCLVQSVADGDLYDMSKKSDMSRGYERPVQETAAPGQVLGIFGTPGTL